MQRKFPDLTPVIHTKDKYTGWIDGVTKIESLFTGKSDKPWQCRVYLEDGTRKVAPEDDLEHIADAPKFPPKELLERYVHSVEGESELHALGYNLTDMNPQQRHRTLVFCAIPMMGPERVLKNLCDILWRKVRRSKAEKIEKYHNAIEQWSHDLDFVLSQPAVHLETLSRDILNYVIAVKEQLKKNTNIPTDFPPEKIADIAKHTPETPKKSGGTP